MLYSSNYDSPLGDYTIICNDSNVVGLWKIDQKHYLGNINKINIIEKETSAINDVKQWLDNYFAGKNPPITRLSIQPNGTEFQKNVWTELLNIPYGEVRSYSEIGTIINKKCPRAIGVAVGRNPISIIIPCHRVIGKNGNLTGYAGGVETKMKLLEIEGIDVSKLPLPK